MAQRRGAPPAPAGRRRGRPGPAPPPAPPAGAGGRDGGGMQRPASSALGGGAAFGPRRCGNGPPACARPCPPRRSRGVRGAGCGSRRREGRRRRRRGDASRRAEGRPPALGRGSPCRRRELPAVAAEPQRHGSRGVRWACARQRSGVRVRVKCTPRTILPAAAASPKHQQTSPSLTLFPAFSVKRRTTPTPKMALCTL